MTRLQFLLGQKAPSCLLISFPVDTVKIYVLWKQLRDDKASFYHVPPILNILTLLISNVNYVLLLCDICFIGVKYHSLCVLHHNVHQITRKILVLRQQRKHISSISIN